MFILNDELKEGVGILIEYYRKLNLENTKDKRWNIGKFIEGDFGKLLCTDKTYKKISSGEHTDDDVIYDKLIRKLGFVFKGMDLPTSNKLLFQYRQLLDAVERSDTRNIEVITEKALEILADYKESLYYRENIEVLNLIRNYYLNSILMDEKAYLKYYQIFGAFNGYLQIMIKELLYRFCHLTYRNVQKLNELSDRIQLAQQTSMMLKINYVGQLMFNQNGFEAFQLGNDMIPKLENVKNYNLLITLYSMMISIVFAAQKNSSHQYLLSLEYLLRECGDQIANRKKGACYYLLGMQYYYLKEYLKAYKFLCESIRFDQLCFQEAGLYIRHMMDFYEVEPCDLSGFNLSIYSERFQVMYHYFDLKNDYKIARDHGKECRSMLMELENYISKKVLSVITKENVLILDLFQKEIDWIASLTFSYSNSQKFRLRVTNLK